MIHVEAEPDPDDLDVGYAQLASEFNSETADGERRAARTAMRVGLERRRREKLAGRVFRSAGDRRLRRG